MQIKGQLNLLVTAFAVVFGFLAIQPPTLAASTEEVLHAFTGKTDGCVPFSGLIWDASGNLYGNAVSCGAGGGVVFQLVPGKGGTWTENELYSFSQYSGNPWGGLVFDAAGNLYGTTTQGGVAGGGNVFKLSPRKNGKWTISQLYSFCPTGTCTDGEEPTGSLIFDAAGNIYGTTYYGGDMTACGGNGCGVVFELTPKANGKWKEKVLHTFGNKATDGQSPYSSLVFDTAGNLYGTTTEGGAYGAGTVFELTPEANGKWKEKVLHNFGKGKDGVSPWSYLIFDTGGNLYGTTINGGAYGGGTAFELTPDGSAWKEKILHSFGNGTDGQTPYASLVFDSGGNLYGTTTYGGAYSQGTVFELTPGSNGKWTGNVLYSFTGGDDGGQPYTANLIFNADGNMYSTTEWGGAYSLGVVFEITP